MNSQPTPEQILQSILQNVAVGGNLTTGDITQILNLLVIIQQPDVFKPKEIPQNIPRSNIIKFVGRAETLVSLHNKLQNSSQLVIAAVEGMGGVGKTELATQYALIHLLLKTYSGGICWLRGREEDIGIQILQFAIAKLGLKPPEDWDVIKQVDFCWSRWHDGDVLIVLDDVTDYPSLEPYLPPASPKFKILITSRLQLNLPQSFTLNVLDESPALELLQAWVGEKVKQESATAKEICKFLGYLPLALNLVGRYVKKRKISLAEMLRRLEEKKINHQSLARDEKDPTWNLSAKLGVIAAFELSWSELSYDAKQLAVLLSLFALAPIPWSLVEGVETGKDAEQLEDSRVELENLNLLQGEESYQLHQLIRQFFQFKQNEIRETEELKRAVCQVMVGVAKKIPYTITLQQVADISPKQPHIEEVAKNLIDYVSDDLIWILSGNALFYYGQGLYAQALFWFEKCWEVAQQRLKEEHPYFATSLHNLAFVYTSQGRYSEAEPIYWQALELRRRLLGEEHPDFATNLNNLGTLYCFQGRYSEAEPLLQQALELRRRLLGEKHPHFAHSLNNLAEIYRSQGRYSEAEPLYQQALELNRRLLGEEHPDFATSLNNLAEIYHSQRRYSEAEPLYQQALELNRRLLGEEHPHFATNLNNLANLYCSQYRYSEAEPLYQQALELNRRLLGEEHPFFVNSLNNLAGLYDLQGKYSEAELLLKQALELNRRLRGEEHPDFAISLKNLAFLYKFQDRYSEAEPLYQQALEICEKSLGVNHPNTVNIRKNLQICQQALGKLPRQENLLDEIFRWLGGG